MHRAEAYRKINKMLEQGVIRPSTSASSSPVILVKKKSGVHPLPPIDDILDSLGDSQYFTTLDLGSECYWQISVDENNRLIAIRQLLRHKMDCMNLTACPLAFLTLQLHFQHILNLRIPIIGLCQIP